MKVFVFFLCLLVPASVAAAQDSAPTPSPGGLGSPPTVAVFVPKDTVVVIATTEAISSYAASPREPISYQVVNDVVVDGHVVAKAGDEAEGQVLESQQGKTGFYGVGYKAADLRISANEIHNFCGDTLKLRFIRSEYRRRQGMFGSKKDVEVIDGQKYIAVTAFPQKICGQETTEIAAPVPSDALPADKS
jgi:hypothetical protein